MRNARRNGGDLSSAVQQAEPRPLRLLHGQLQLQPRPQRPASADRTGQRGGRLHGQDVNRLGDLEVMSLAKARGLVVISL